MKRTIFSYGEDKIWFGEKRSRRVNLMSWKLFWMQHP
jgi:hypothetical protein